MHPQIPAPDPRLLQFENALPLWVQLMQLAFYGGLIVLIVGLPVFIWLWIRLCRDIHWIQRALWAHYDLARHHAPAAVSAETPATSGAPRVINSAFGR